MKEIIICNDYKLRMYHSNDAAYFHDIMQDDELESMMGSKSPKTLHECENLVDMYRTATFRRLAYFWAIARQQDDALVGHIELSRFKTPTSECNLAYFVNAKFRRRGIASSAVCAVAQFWRESMEIKHIRTVVRFDNVASIKTLQRCGFTLREFMKNYKFGDINTDCFLIGIDKE